MITAEEAVRLTEESTVKLDEAIQSIDLEIRKAAKMNKRVIIYTASSRDFRVAVERKLKEIDSENKVKFKIDTPVNPHCELWISW